MTRLEKTTHICLITLSMVALVLLVEKRLAHFGSAAPTQQLVGKHLGVSGLDWKTSPLNAVLFISSHCHFCEESMPFYRNVSAARSRTSRILVISPDAPQIMKAALSRERVAVDGIYTAPPIAELRGTPTVLIVDAKGIVRRVFVGKLGSSSEHELLALVRAQGSK